MRRCRRASAVALAGATVILALGGCTRDASEDAGPRLTAAQLVAAGTDICTRLEARTRAVMGAEGRVPAPAWALRPDRELVQWRSGYDLAIFLDPAVDGAQVAAIDDELDRRPDIGRQVFVDQQAALQEFSLRFAHRP